MMRKMTMIMTMTMKNKDMSNSIWKNLWIINNFKKRLIKNSAI